MKKLYFLLATMFFALSASNVSAQCYTAPFTESFNTTTQPSCVLISATTGGPWVFNAGFFWNTSGCSGTPVDHTGNSGSFAAMDQSGTDAGVILELDTIDVSLLTVPYLEFYYQMCGVGYSPVNILFVEAFNGTGWNVVDTIQQGTVGWERFGYDVSTNTFGTNLMKIRFRAESGGAGIDFYGDQALDDISVIEAPTCFPLSNFGTANLTTTSIDLSWTDPNTAGSYQIEWDTAGFAQGTGNLVLTTSNPYNLTGLTAFTNYDWYVRAICGPADTSVWGFGGSFFTGYCTPAPTSVDGQGIVNVAFDTVNNPTGAEPGNYGDYSALIGNVGQGQLIPVNITYATGLTYNTEIYIDWNNDLDFNDPGENVYSGVSLGVNPTTLNATFTVPAMQPLGQYRMRIGGADFATPIPCYTGSWASFEDYTVNVTPPPSCSAPTALFADSIGADSALLFWTDNASATQWQIEWDTTGFTQGTGNLVITGNNPYVLTGLTPVSTYDFYVRAICGAMDTSAWAIPASFTTACAAFTAPWTDDVEAHTPTTNLTSSLCWTATANNTGNDWNIDGAGSTPSTGTGPASANSGTNYFYFEASGGTAGNEAYLVSPSVDVSALTAPRLTFFYHMWGDNRGVMADLFVEVFDGTRFVLVDSIIGQQQTSQAAPFAQRIVDISTFTGIISVRFTAKWNGAQWGDISLDDFVIEERPLCPAPSALVSNITSTTSADLSWTENGVATEWQVQWDTAGFSPGTGRGDSIANNDSITLNGLTTFTNYDWYVRAICGRGDTSVWTQGNFNINYCTPAPTSTDGQGIVNVAYDTVNNSTGSEPGFYGDYSNFVGNAVQGQVLNVDVTYATGFTYNTEIFVDWNNDLDFNDTLENVYSGVSLAANPTTLNTSFLVPASVPLGQYRMRIGGADFGVVTPCYTGSFAAFEDYTINVIAPVPNDLGVVSIDPLTDKCGTSTDTITVTIVNFGTSNQTGFPLGYSINGVAITPETFTGTINAGDTGVYTFTTTTTYPGTGVMNINAYTALTTDTSNNNDSSSTSLIIFSNVSTFPYAESFESGNGGWTAQGTTTFDLGAPAGAIIDTASDGTQAWVTNLTGLYNVNEAGWVNSPCFDLTGIFKPMIELDIWYDAEFSWDGAVLQATTDGGLSWIKIGDFLDTVNWYTDNSIAGLGGLEPSLEGWSGTGTSGSAGWLTAKHDLDTLLGQSSVRFRVVFGSDGSIVDEGFAFDNVKIYDDSIPPPPVIPYYPVGIINTVDANGVADSLNVRVMTSGTVVGVNLFPAGVSFTIIDYSTNQQEGIAVFNSSPVSGYTVNEGDSVMLIGDVDQFRGLQQIAVDSIMVIKTNAFVPAPRLVTDLDESTESNLIELRDLRLLDGSGSGSYNMDATNGTDTITIRVDGDTDVNDSLNVNAWVVGDTICSIVGVGGQFKFSSPFTSGYQVFPMRFSDIDTASCQIVSVTEIQGEEGKLSIFPNPTNDVVTIIANQLSTNDARLMVRDITGKIIFEERLNSNTGFSETLDFSGRANGVYFITIIDGDNMIHEKLIKN